MPSRDVCYHKELLLDLKTTQNNSISFAFLNRNLVSAVNGTMFLSR